MKTIIKLAWRNIWRNKRRTAITAASVLFAVFFALIMRSMQIGSYSHMINNVVQAFTGYIQIHKAGYWEDKDINNSMEFTDSIVQSINSIKNIKSYVPRLESFALASFNQQTKGIALVGTDPEKENQLSGLRKKLISGDYLTKNDSCVLIAKKLSEYLKIKVNDTLVLISQGFHGNSAAGKFKVKGIVHFPNPELDNSMIYTSLPTCQSFYSAENRLTSVSMNLSEVEKINETVDNLKSSLGTINYEFMKWDEILVEIVQHVEVDTASGKMMLGILYLVIAFGVFGTVLMMTLERIKEFGVMVSVGMQKIKLAIMMSVETIFLGIIGTLSGIILSLPVIIYYLNHPIRLTGETGSAMERFGIEPILPFALQSGYFINQSLIVLMIVFLTIIYPVWKILNMKEINALRNKI